MTNHRSGRRLLAGLSAVLAATLAVAGCSDGSAKSGSPKGSAGGTPHRGGSLVVADDSQPLSGLDPIMAQAWNAKRLAGQFYEGLLSLGTDGQTLEPALATSWKEVSPTKYEFTLRSGVTFHNGDPVTAQDVVFSLTRIVDKDQHSPYIALYSFKDVKAAGAGKVVVELTRPQASLLHLLAQPWSAGIVNEKWIKSKSADDLKTQENGTGPYQLVDFREGSVIKTKRFAKYWESGKPYIDTIDYRLIQDESTRLQALQSGSVDMMQAKLPKNVDGLKARGMNVGTKYNVGSWWIGLNMGKGPLANEKVRQAVSLGLDRKQLIKIGSQGSGQLAGSVPPADPLGSDVPEDYPNYRYDPDRAKKLLAESGVKNIKLKLVLQSEVATNLPTAELIEQQLSAIGIDVEIQQLPFSQLVTNLLSGDWKADMIQLTAALNADASQYLELWFGKGIPSTKVNDPTLWTMMDDAVHKAKSDKERRAMYSDINKYIAEHAYMIVPYASPLAIDVWSSKVHGFDADRSGTRIFLKNAWVR